MNLVEALRRLWDDPGIKECYKRRIEYGLGEGAQHFVKNITRITTSGYVPSQEDYLCIKTPSKCTDFVILPCLFSVELSINRVSSISSSSNTCILYICGCAH